MTVQHDLPRVNSGHLPRRLFLKGAVAAGIAVPFLSWGNVSGQEDPAEVKKKEQQVRDLEKRKADLEKAIQLSIAPK